MNREPLAANISPLKETLWGSARQALTRLDSAILASGIILFLLLLSDRSQFVESLIFTAETLYTLAPYLLFAFVIGAYLRASSVDLLVTSVFRGRIIVVIFAAAFLGAMSPFCSCSVVALVAVLLRTGMPLSAIMTFWISSPIISPGMYVLTGAVLGYEFASAKLVAAIFMGLGVGFATLLLERLGYFRNPLRNGTPARKVSLGEAVSPHWLFWKDPASTKVFWQELVTVTRFLTKWMVLAFLIESLLIRYIPAEMVAQWVGTANVWAIPLATILGAPAYVNGVAAVPLVEGLMKMGMSGGAALGFLLAGSVTSIPAMAAVLPLVNKRVFGWYVLMGFVTSLIAALSFSLYLAWT